MLVLTGSEVLAGSAEWDRRRMAGLSLGLATAMLTAGVLLQIRRLSSTESPGAIAFNFALLCTLAGLAPLPLGWVIPEGPTLWLLIASGLLGGLAHICMTLSFRLAEASALAPLEYLTLIWAVAIDLALSGTPIGSVFALALPLLLASAAITGRGEPTAPADARARSRRAHRAPRVSGTGDTVDTKHEHDFQEDMGVILFPPLSAQLLEESPPMSARHARPICLAVLLLVPLPVAADPALIDLGRALFNDMELSGSREYSCVSCHPPAMGLEAPTTNNA